LKAEFEQFFFIQFFLFSSFHVTSNRTCSLLAVCPGLHQRGIQRGIGMRTLAAWWGAAGSEAAGASQGGAARQQNGSALDVKQTKQNKTKRRRRAVKLRKEGNLKTSS